MQFRTKLLTCITPLILAIATTALAAENSVKLGVLVDMSSVYADATGSGSVLAAKAIEDFGGSVLNRPVEILAGDHQNKPDVAASIARGWIDKEKVDAFAEVQNTAVTLAILHLAVASKKIVPMSTNGSPLERTYTFLRVSPKAA